MAAVVNTLDTYLAQYLSSAEIAKFKGHAQVSPLAGKALILDYPIKKMDEYFARACMFMNYMNYGGFNMIVANEGGAIIGALRAAGYSFLEIAGLRADGTLDILKLIEGGQKMPQALHVRTKGSDHKGLRLRDAIDNLLKAKIPGTENHLVTFADLQRAPVGRVLYITVMDTKSAGIVPLCAQDFPSMSVADAVLASCAVPPYIAPVLYTKADGTKYEFYSCSGAQSLPIATAEKIFFANKSSGNFASSVAGYGYKGTDNEAGATNATGTSFQKSLMSQRAAAIVPEAMRRGVMLY
jgi:hypothetical protein